MRIRRSGLREDGLEMLTARRRIVLQSIGPLLQLDFPPSDVAPLPAWGILAARGRYARPASLYPSIFRVGPRSSKLAAPPSRSHLCRITMSPKLSSAHLLMRHSAWH